MISSVVLPNLFEMFRHAQFFLVRQSNLGLHGADLRVRTQSVASAIFVEYAAASWWLTCLPVRLQTMRHTVDARRLSEEMSDAQIDMTFGSMWGLQSSAYEKNTVQYFTVQKVSGSHHNNSVLYRSFYRSDLTRKLINYNIHMYWKLGQYPA